MMKRDEWFKKLFQAIDNQNSEAFLAFLSENVFFQFGNAKPVRGKMAVGDSVNGFFESIKGLQHNLTEILVISDTVICHGTVTYTRHDSSILSVPFANIFKVDADLIKDYIIYVDISELYKN